MKNAIRTNRDQLVILSVMGEITDPPVNLNQPYRLSADGWRYVVPGTGGITYNARIGDSALNWQGDHIEPAVSIKNRDHREGSPGNGGLNILSCVGNRATVISGDARGSVGRVTGKHGGVEHILIDFELEAMEKMAIGDKIQIKSCGQGMLLPDFPGISVMNLDPDLFRVMGLSGNIRTKRIKVPVTHLVPAEVMGSGLGKSHTFSGDYDIQMFDPPTVEKFHLDTLRFGDIVAIVGADHSYGRIYRQESISVGVIVHSRSVVAGHGPGVTTLLTSKEGLIDPVIDQNANLRFHFEKLDS